ncbi:hypothetical protein SYNPCC7002_F0104 (plasmid) [Picosynechococcus sp. PCC 7002]|nr:hypothetical protein SYNPCC7002_F0104 [Picosynechococcus sp. PCC 7002]
MNGVHANGTQAKENGRSGEPTDKENQTMSAEITHGLDV